MHGDATKLAQFMQGNDKRFIIPVYQRNYDWKTENCKQLYDDLIRVIKQDRSSHFFGSIVSVSAPEKSFNSHLIIDGQQRLTTVSLLLIALKTLLDNGEVSSDKKNLKDQIYKEYLVDEWNDDENRIKLKPVKDDSAAFGKLFNDDEENIPNSNITINYEYFCNRIRREELTADELFDAFKRLEIISITLTGDDNPQLIFESLNSTGVALSEGDKIRNFILMGQPPKQQAAYYEKYWNRIEKTTGYSVSAFVRDYLSIKQHSTPRESNVYFVFKNYVIENAISVEPLLQDLLSYAQRYQILIGGKSISPSIDASIFRLNRLKTTVTRPFLLEVLTLLEKGNLDILEVEKIFYVVENYLIRRNICDVPTNALNKIFISLHRDIKRYDGTLNDYVEKFKYALLSKKESGRFPDDAEFTDILAVKQVYKMNSKNKTYILERLENFGTKEDKAVYSHIDDGTYSIEHIMPQHLTPSWVDALGDEYKRIHETWLHRLANLTLTAYNSEYSNSPFSDKKTMENGFIDSGIRLNQYIAVFDRWTEDELEKRNQHLIKRAIKIWKYPESSYVPPQKQYDSYTLEDSEDLTNAQIVKFSYKGIEQPATSWIDMFVGVLKILYSEDESILRTIAYKEGEDSGLAAYINIDPKCLRKPLELADGIFIERNTSTKVKVTLLQRVFDEYGADQDELIFYLKNENEPADPINGMRRQYWKYLLDRIHECVGEDGPYSNVNPAREEDNWLPGFFGVGGFHISCVTNSDHIKTEVILTKSEKALNKEAFDYLYSHKEEIEEKAGEELYWDRSDKNKASKIGVVLDNMYYKDEADHDEMAEFHATWVKKYYDIIVPYLIEWDGNKNV